MAIGNAEAVEHLKYGDGEKHNNHYNSDNTLRNEFYNMDHKYRGKALIFSHDFYENLPLQKRHGNDKDCQRMVTCLELLSFSVSVFCNLKYAEIMNQIELTAKMDHSKNDCLLIAVLTHGHSHAFLFARDLHYRAETLWRRFTDKNCPTLAGKPRLFIIQACQGEKLDDGITLYQRSNYTEADGSFEPHKVPFHRDFLLALSSVPGYASWRNMSSGSWFIQELCEELERSATETDILTLLTFVSQKVALNYESNNHEGYSKKAVPYFSSLLTRRLVFTKKTDSSISHGKGLLARNGIAPASSVSLLSNGITPASSASLPSNDMRPASCASLPSNGMTPANSAGLPRNGMTPASSPSLPSNDMTPASSASLSNNDMRPASSASLPSNGMTPASSASLPRNCMTPASSASLPSNDMTPASSASLSSNGMTPASSASLPRNGMTPASSASFSSNGMSPASSVSLPRNGMTSASSTSLPSNGMTPTSSVSLPRNGMTPASSTSLPRNRMTPASSVSSTSSRKESFFGYFGACLGY